MFSNFCSCSGLINVLSVIDCIDFVLYHCWHSSLFVSGCICVDVRRRTAYLCFFGKGF